MKLLIYLDDLSYSRFNTLNKLDVPLDLQAKIAAISLNLVLLGQEYLHGVRHPVFELFLLESFLIQILTQPVYLFKHLITLFFPSGWRLSSKILKLGFQ